MHRSHDAKRVAIEGQDSNPFEIAAMQRNYSCNRSVKHASVAIPGDPLRGATPCSSATPPNGAPLQIASLDLRSSFPSLPPAHPPLLVRSPPSAMFRSTVAPARPSPTALTPPPALTLEQLILSRQQQHSAQHAPPPAALLYPSPLHSELLESCMEPATTAADAWAAVHTTAHTQTTAQGQQSIVALHAHPAADIWRAKWTELATTHIPKSHTRADSGAEADTTQRDSESDLNSTLARCLHALCSCCVVRCADITIT